jgi:hypothetical protein
VRVGVATKAKIKIIDNSELRAEIDQLADSLSQVDLAQWAILCAKHVLLYSESEFPANEAIANGFRINDLWQNGQATVHQVRQASFKIHEIARQCQSKVAKSAIRAAGQAVGVGHMREHAMVASDYAIKTIQLAFANDLDKITEERQWQLNQLKQFL